jgi:glutathione S-transferase
MQLIGMMDSPYVRRVAISMKMMGIGFEHRALSVIQGYDEFRVVMPLVKVPTLVCDDGEMLVDSSLILDYLESQVPPERRLLPSGLPERRQALQSTGVALVAMEKAVQLIYETRQRPESVQHAPWIERLVQQLHSAMEMMESSVEGLQAWLADQKPGQADITTAVAWRFIQIVFPERFPMADWPGLSRYCERAEALPEFIDCPPK